MGSMLGDSLGVSLGMVLINIRTLSHSLNSISPILLSCHVLAEHHLQNQYTIQHIWANRITLSSLLYTDVV